MKTNNIYNNGYGVVSSAVTMDTRLTTTARAIYATIASYAGNKKYAYPTIPTLCHAVGVTKNTLNKHMAYLLAYGYIIKKQYKTNESKYANNIYVIQETPEENSILVSKIANKKLSDKKNSLPIFKETEIIEAVKNETEKYVQSPQISKVTKPIEHIALEDIQKEKIKVPEEDAKAIKYLVKALGQAVSEKDIEDIYQDAKGKIDVITAKYEIIKQAGLKIIKRPVGILRKAIKENWQPSINQEKQTEKTEKPCTKFPYTKNVATNNNIRKFINDDVNVNKELLTQQINCKQSVAGKTEKEKAMIMPTQEQKQEIVNCFKQKDIMLSERDILDIFNDAKGEVCAVLNYFETFLKKPSSHVKNHVGLIRKALQQEWTIKEAVKATNAFDNFTNRVYDADEMRKKLARNVKDINKK